jgi:hypothetical protein
MNTVYSIITVTRKDNLDIQRIFEIAFVGRGGWRCGCAYPTDPTLQHPYYESAIAFADYDPTVLNEIIAKVRNLFKEASIERRQEAH